MPRLNKSGEEVQQLKGGFTFSGTRVDKLGATEYTLVTIAVDETGSVAGFSDELRNMLVAAVNGCRKSPRANNLLIRVLTFGSQYPRGVNEIHGFKLLADIEVNDYPQIRPGGSTPLCDACYSGVGAMNAYGKKLADSDYLTNGILFVVTDGGENCSTATMNMVKEELKKAVTGEVLESLVSILIGINTAESYVKDALAEFQKEAGIDKLINAGEATPQKLAKIAGFVSQSVSSQSQALGTGGPSQKIAPTI